MGLPFKIAAQNDPVNESPAPTVSATFTFGVSWNDGKHRGFEYWHIFNRAVRDIKGNVISNQLPHLGYYLPDTQK